ncbi:MAG: HepT-like ribonuclease domain-containing protein [Caulobacteraceae bacterium]
MEKVATYVAGQTEFEFYGQQHYIDAVALNLLVLGEAASKLSENLKATKPEVRWRNIVNLRHRIAHGYTRVDATVLWQVAQEDASALRIELRQLLYSLDT